MPSGGDIRPFIAIEHALTLYNWGRLAASSCIGADHSVGRWGLANILRPKACGATIPNFFATV